MVHLQCLENFWILFTSPEIENTHNTTKQSFHFQLCWLKPRKFVAAVAPNKDLPRLACPQPLPQQRGRRHLQERLRWSDFLRRKKTEVASQNTSYLVGGFNPIAKYAHQIGSFPQVGMKIKNIWNHHLEITWKLKITCLKRHDFGFQPFIFRGVTILGPFLCWGRVIAEKGQGIAFNSILMKIQGSFYFSP